MTMPRPSTGKLRFTIAFWISCCALVYALLAGLKTVVDFDLGWQMATARYIWQHHAIPSTEVFSYTAHGASWIYPVLSGAVFLAAYKLGGYVLISWLCAISCLAAVAALCVGRSAWTAALALLSVPVIAEQSMPRSGLFTVLLFALFARVILEHFEGRHARLWLLPVLMVLWVNLHLGFIAGLGLLMAYLLLELLELPFSERRKSAQIRLRQSSPWLVAAVAATLFNPWEWRIWTAVSQQEFVSRTEQIFVQEFRPIGAVANWAEWRNPDNAIYWMIVLGAVAMAFAFSRRRFGPALILLTALAAAPRHARISGPFVVVAVLFGGAEFTRAASRIRSRKLMIAGTCALMILAAIRCNDLVTNRFYITDGQLTLFGAGPAWWLPERATEFMRKQHLPREVFSTFNLSSYLVWKLGEEYPDFDDGRYIPFGDALFYEQRSLASLPLDSPVWEDAVRKRNIRTVIFPLAPLLALGDFPLKEDCSSIRWAPVYMDGSALIFVRRDAIPDAIKRMSRSVCEADEKELTSDSRGERYQQLLNAAGVNYLLGHISEARALAARAGDISADDSALHLLQAEIALAGMNRDEAERQFRISVAKMPSDSGWYGLAVLYMNEQRYDEALTAFRQSARLAGLERYQRLYALGKAYAVAKQADEALRMLDEAQAQSPFQDASSSEAAEFLAGIAEAKAAAYTEQGDTTRAIAEQRRAVQYTPKNALRWHLLAETYAAFGMTKEAQAAEQRAQATAQ